MKDINVDGFCWLLERIWGWVGGVQEILSLKGLKSPVRNIGPPITGSLNLVQKYAAIFKNRDMSENEN